jgi:hypothetical protein
MKIEISSKKISYASLNGCESGGGHNMKRILMLLAIVLTPLLTQAKIIELGEIDLTGNFTLNHNFDFNNASASPFGTFGTLTAQSATGIFVPYVVSGDTLTMNTPFMYVSSGVTPVVLPNGDVVFGSLAAPMQWSIGGFTINTLWDVITGPDSGRNSSGIGDLSGNGYDPSAYPVYPLLTWDFTAPPYDINNFPTDITGPINMTIEVAFDNGVVPETGNSLALLALALTALAATKIRYESRHARSRC